MTREGRIKKDKKRTAGQHPETRLKGAAKDCGQCFFLRENPNSKLFGEKETSISFIPSCLSHRHFFLKN